MNLKQTWQDFLDQHGPSFIGGDIQRVIETPEGAFRGPITAIAIEGDTLVITTEWTAHIAVNTQDTSTGNWKRFNNTQSQYSIKDGILSPPKDIGKGCVHFTYCRPHSRILLIPKGGSKLDPQKVEGL